MKLSIWRQFSSNHSSSFIVIGRFKNVETAQAKEAEFRDWLYRMLWGNDELNVSKRLAEAEIMTKYGIDWYDEGIDWNGYPDYLEGVVRRLSHDVIVMCPFETWDSHRPFADLMTAMGAQTIFANQDDMYSFGMCVQLTCDAPDTRTAERLAAEMTRVIEDRRNNHPGSHYIPIPWAVFNPDFDTYDADLSRDDYAEQEAIFVADINAWRTFYTENITDEDDNPVGYEEKKRVESQRGTFFRQIPPMQHAIARIRQHVSPRDGLVRRDEKIITVSNLEFVYVDTGLIALINWLEKAGCDIRYEFSRCEQE